MEILAPDPADHVLEIGCGTGVAAGLILQKLTNGRLTAIDRSAAMIRAAERLNRASVASGMARFWNVALEEAEFAGERFDKILAVNVNRFWLKPADESGLWTPLLKPGGVVCLVYQPPPGQSTDRIVDGCSESFQRSGFSEVQVLQAKHLDPPVVCIRASDYRS
ncbi:MAG TPA: class I SAM-dependent methyltransferase [Thermoanaerobaculia bacterium]|nr:class I SAM-dependent methyltransferase [Thermoanaerobaculia bacterium]